MSFLRGLAGVADRSECHIDQREVGMTTMAAVVPDSIEDRLLTAEEVGELIGVSGYTVREWAREHRIPHVRFGGRTLRFRLSSVQAWIAEQEQQDR
jgi:excisionase family DNA binding protein